MISLLQIMPHFPTHVQDSASASQATLSLSSNPRGSRLFKTAFFFAYPPTFKFRQGILQSAAVRGRANMELTGVRGT